MTLGQGPWGHGAMLRNAAPIDSRPKGVGTWMHHRDPMSSQGASVVRHCKSLFSGVIPCVNGQHNHLHQSFPNSPGERHPSRESVGSSGQLCSIAGALY